MAVPEPRMKTVRLELRNRYYAVPLQVGEGFAYFPIIVDEDLGKPFLRMIKAPPVLLEGFAIINKQIYKLTAEDILRRVVRKSNLVTLESINGSNTSSTNGDNSELECDDDYIEYGSRDSAPSISPIEVIKRILDSNKRGVSQTTGVEVGTSADLAWAEQVRSLLGSETEEEIDFQEGWEIEDTSQS